MTINIKNTSKRVTTEPVANSQVSARANIFEQDVVDEEAVKEDSERMDAMMRQLMGGNDDDDEEEEEVEEAKDMEDVKEEGQQEEFVFNLFASQTIAKVNIADDKDTTDDWAQAVADQQVYEFDETEPEFVARVKEAAIDFDTIMKQSTTPYPALRFPRRIIHILSPEEEAKKTSTEKKVTKKRKSKKCRDFEKAVKSGKIILKPNMRDPKTPDGWPGWPGARTPVAIIDYDATKKRANSSRGGRGGARGRGIMRGSSRGGSGGVMRGNSRGGSGGMMSRTF
ncbi:hypothetical protein HPULCUR_008238 [Helicostylum pulchrum]|uniref:Uncharacterized protein n=1 Tax=Helicostylum pulchrum TaxID=562976 RepID=A0ABP9Y857_9FUNG